MAEEDTSSPPSSPPPTPELVEETEVDADLEGYTKEQEDEDIVAATEAAAAAAAAAASSSPIASTNTQIQRRDAPNLEDRRAKHSRTSQKWSIEEKQTLFLGHRAFGGEANRWVLISTLLLPGRSTTALSNLWRSERYQKELEDGEPWTFDIPSEIKERVKKVVKTFRAENKHTGDQDGDDEGEKEEEDEEGDVAADFLTEAIGMFQPTGQISSSLATNLPTACPAPTIAAPKPIELPVLRKRKGAPPAAKVSFASSSFAKKPAGSALDSDLLSVPNLYPNLTLSAISSIPGHVIVTEKEFSQYAHEQLILSERRAGIVSLRPPPAIPKPTLPDPYHPLGYFRSRGHKPEGVPVDVNMQTDFNLCNPLEKHPFDQELEDALWCGESEK